MRPQHILRTSFKHNLATSEMTAFGRSVVMTRIDAFIPVNPIMPDSFSSSKALNYD